MSLLKILILISSISFIAYGVAYFTSPHMKNEFRRFGLEKPGLWIVILELSGAIGLIVGFKLSLVLMISSGGLAILMFLGVLVRLKGYRILSFVFCILEKSGETVTKINLICV